MPYAPVRPTHRDAALQALRLLRQHGHQALWAGGCVRDLLLGRDPADYDVATSATPDEVMRIFPQTYAVGAQFGVVLVPLKALGDYGDGDRRRGHIEVATFRSDGAYLDGRHPDSVRYTTSPQHDVERRDFTINGLLLDPLSAHPNTPHGELLDYVEGRRDLERGIVRTIGQPEQRFAEDKLRMLRAVRFAARFGYVIEAATCKPFARLAPQIHQVSCERIRDELSKMLTEGQARRAFQLLDETGLLREVLPEITRMKGVEQPPQFHPEGDVFVHTLLLLEGLPAGLLADPGLGRAAARCGQARDLPARARPHSLRRPRRDRRAHRRRSAHAPALQQSRPRADPRAGGKPHALCRRAQDEGLHLQALCAPAGFR